MAVGAEDHEVLDVRAVELDRAVHGVVERRVRPAGTLKRSARGVPGASSAATRVGRQRQAGAVVLPRLAPRFGPLALVAQPLGRAVAVVGVPGSPQALGRRSR